MAQINIAEIRPSGTIEGKVDALYDAYFMMRKQMMYYLSGALDSENVIEAATVKADWVYAGTLVADQINAVQGIILGDNATIAWSSITDANTYSLGAWKASGYATHIDANGVYTGTLTANQINAVQGITLGANATISWADLPSLPTASQVGALPSNTYIPTTSDITQITASYVATPNLITNIAQVSKNLSLGGGYQTSSSLSFDGIGSIDASGGIMSFSAFGGIAFNTYTYFNAYVDGLEGSGYAKTSTIQQWVTDNFVAK